MNQNIGDLFVELTLKHDKIKTEAEKAQKELRLAIEKGSKAAVIEASLKVDKFKKELKDAENAVKTSFDRMKNGPDPVIQKVSWLRKEWNGFVADAVKVGSGFLAANAIMGAFRGIAAELERSTKAVDEEAQAQAKLSNSLGYSVDGLVKYATAMQLKTRFDDGQIMRAQAMIATRVKDEESIKRLTKAAMDFATAQEMDVVSAAELLTKTVASSTNALSRYGIEIDGAAASNERLEDLILKVNKAYGGQAEAIANIGTGPLEIQRKKLEDIKEQLAENIIPLQLQWAEINTGLVSTVANLLSKYQLAAEIAGRLAGGQSVGSIQNLRLIDEAKQAGDVNRLFDARAGILKQIAELEKQISDNRLRREENQNSNGPLYKQWRLDKEYEGMSKTLTDLRGQSLALADAMKTMNEESAKGAKAEKEKQGILKLSNEDEKKAEEDRLEIARKAREYAEDSLNDHVQETNKRIQYEDKITKESLDRQNKYTQEALTAQQKLRIASIREQAEGFEQTARNEKLSIEERNEANQAAHEKRIQLIKLEEQFALQAIAKQKAEALGNAKSDKEKKAIEDWYSALKQQIENDTGIKIRADIKSVVDIEVDKSSIRESGESFYAVTDLALRSLAGNAKNTFDELNRIITTLAYNIGDKFGEVGSDIGGIVGMAISLFTTMIKPMLNESNRIKNLTEQTNKMVQNSEKTAQNFLKIVESLELMSKYELEKKMDDTFEKLAEFFNSTQSSKKNTATGEQLKDLYLIGQKYTPETLAAFADDLKNAKNSSDFYALGSKWGKIMGADAKALSKILIEMAGGDLSKILEGAELAILTGRPKYSIYNAGNGQTYYHDRYSQRLGGSGRMDEYVGFMDQLGTLNTNIQGYDYGANLDPFSIPTSEGKPGFEAAKDILNFWKDSGKISEYEYKTKLTQLSEKFKDYISPLDYQIYKAQQSLTLNDIYDQASVIQEQVSSGYLTYEAGSAKMQALQDQAVSLATNTYGAGSYEAYRAKMEIVVKVDGSAVDENTARIIGETINEGIETYDMSRGGGSEV